jgi:hypothetical protein
MAEDAPMATLRLASDSLDPDRISQILSFGPVAPRINTKRHVWFASTDQLASKKPEDHLSLFISALRGNLNEIVAAYPDVRITFSVLISIPGYDIKDFPKPLISEATKMGELVFEFPLRGEEIFLTIDRQEVCPA